MRAWLSRVIFIARRGGGIVTPPREERRASSPAKRFVGRGGPVALVAMRGEFVAEDVGHTFRLGPVLCDLAAEEVDGALELVEAVDAVFDADPGGGMDCGL